MKHYAIIAAIFLAGCEAQSTDSMSEMRLSTADDFAPILGKRLMFGDVDYVVINADGTLIGDFGGVDTRGTWELKDGYLCRSLTAGPRGASPEDCQLVVRKGDVLSITRDRGDGPSFDYVIS
jgi:hypothetical protein